MTPQADPLATILSPSDSSREVQPLVVLAGPRGGGVSTALSGLAQQGWMTLDQVPLATVSADWLLTLRQQQQAPLAIGLAPLKADDLASYAALLPTLPSPHHTIWLEATPEILQGRTAAYTSVESALSTRLSAPAGVDYVVDTSLLRMDELWRKVDGLLGNPARQTAAPMAVCLQSFAFKRGVPADADWVLDARVLPNPFYDRQLKALTGQAESVQSYVMDSPVSQAFWRHVTGLLKDLLPAYAEQGRARLTVAIGCTGGKHRSVTLVEKLAVWLADQQPQCPTVVHHREAPYWGASLPIDTRLSTQSIR